MARRVILLALAMYALTLNDAALPEDGMKTRYGPWGVDYADMDASVKPGDDFFDYVEGTWLKTHPIPADKTGAGYNYDLPDETDLQIRDLVEEAAHDAGNPIARQIGDFYAAWMDQAGIEARGLDPLKPYRARLTAIRTTHATRLADVDAGLCLTSQPSPSIRTSRNPPATRSLPARRSWVCPPATTTS